MTDMMAEKWDAEIFQPGQQLLGPAKALEAACPAPAA